MTASLPSYTIEQLAPGSYDVLLNGTLVAALVRGIDGLGDDWRVDLLDEAPSSDRPPPFTGPSHTFRSLPAALDWLGIREGASPMSRWDEDPPSPLLGIGVGTGLKAVANSKGIHSAGPASRAQTGELV